MGRKPLEGTEMKPKITHFLIVSLMLFLVLGQVSADEMIDITKENNVTYSDIQILADRIGRNEEDVIKSYIVIDEVHTMFAKQQMLLFGVGLSLVGGMCLFNYFLWKWLVRFIRRQLGIFDISRDEIRMIIEYMKKAETEVKQDKEKKKVGFFQSIKNKFFGRTTAEVQPIKQAGKKGGKK